MIILVTGSEGLIGKPLVKRLRELGHKVITNDLSGNPDYKCSFVDLKVRCDILIHLAAVVGVDTTRHDPDLVLKVNFTDTKQLIDRYKNKRIIFASSSEVYGSSLQLPFNEKDAPTPMSLYGSLKVVIENYLKEKNINCGIVRFFNVYGPGQRNEFVVSKFIKLAQEKKPLCLYGNGEQLRCFTYVDDAVEGIIKVINYKSRYDIFNIGNTKQTTIAELAETVNKLISCKIKYIDYGTKDVRGRFLEILKRYPDVSKAKKLLNWEATTSLKKGICNILQ